MNDFKVGDIISGIAGNGYSITNENMKKAIVLEVNKEIAGKYNIMKIEILNYKNKNNIGFTFIVNNTSSKFKKYIPKSQELHITTDGYKTYGIYKEDGKVVKREEARCHPDDTFDFKIGADTVINRIFPKEEPIKKETKKILILEAEGKELGVLGEEIDKTDSWGQPLHIGDVVGYYAFGIVPDHPIKVGEAVVISKEELIVLYKKIGFKANQPIGVCISHKDMKKGQRYYNTEIRVKEKEIKQ